MICHEQKQTKSSGLVRNLLSPSLPSVEPSENVSAIRGWTLLYKQKQTKASGSVKPTARKETKSSGSDRTPLFSLLPSVEPQEISVLSAKSAAPVSIPTPICESANKSAFWLTAFPNQPNSPFESYK